MNAREILDFAKMRLGNIDYLRGWWRPWLLTSATWILISTFMLHWLDPAYSEIHEEPYYVEGPSSVDVRTMQTMTEQQRIKDEDRRSREAEKSFNDAFIKGDGRAYCFGKMSVFPGQHSLPWLYIVIPDKNLDYTDQGIQHIKWSCDSVFGRLSNFIINILILISFPLLLPTVTLAVIAVSRWIKAGFK